MQRLTRGYYFPTAEKEGSFAALGFSKKNKKYLKHQEKWKGKMLLAAAERSKREHTGNTPPSQGGSLTGATSICTTTLPKIFGLPRSNFGGESSCGLQQTKITTLKTYCQNKKYLCFQSVLLIVVLLLLKTNCRFLYMLFRKCKKFAFLFH